MGLDLGRVKCKCGYKLYSIYKDKNSNYLEVICQKCKGIFVKLEEKKNESK